MSWLKSRHSNFSRATALVGMLVFGTVGFAQENAVHPEGLRQMGFLMQEKAARTPAQRKISSNLLHTLRLQQGSFTRNLPNFRTGVKLDDQGKTVVDIRGEVSDEVLHRIQALGGTVINALENYGHIRAAMTL
ncbi:MAG: hypothetical protein QNK37_21295, partial [Acidobacteriota bacterium]|nr:hypothetical protein [Acidobacteriota bacterium]